MSERDVEEIHWCPTHHVILTQCCGDSKVVGFIETKKEVEKDVQD